jgi:hypothetical protein
MRKLNYVENVSTMLVVNFVCVWKRSVFPERVLILTRRECCQHGLSVSFLVESAVILALGNGIFVDVIGPSTVCQVKPFQRVLNLKVAICNPPSK